MNIKKIPVLLITLLTTQLLIACALVNPIGDESEVECPDAQSTNEAMICGKALRLELGPADEVVESVPIEEGVVLIAPAGLFLDDQDETNFLQVSEQLFLDMEKESTTVQLVTDPSGDFSASLASGEYLICFAFAPPWTTVESFGCTKFAHASSGETKINISFSPMIGDLHFTIE